MQDRFEGLDPTAEAELDVAEAVEQRTRSPESAAPDRASLARALRDLEAAKARVERDAQASAQELREKLVLDLVPVLDNLDRTIAAAHQAGDSPSVVEGVRLVRNQFLGVLLRFGVQRLETKHQRFDPKLHEAINMVPVSHPSAHNVVVDQIEPGYTFGDKLLRPAKVIVGRYTQPYH
ncbi:MAG TPA: nucleotide exchange factor GrpE [Kofleriaceae bacterium]|jgi:molecular chaperone GrpE (heat shock protein)|nr:nucleotide exchange factor GrpE [Kofleriaceae bacterium]